MLDGPSAADRRRAVVVAGHRGEIAVARRGLTDPNPSVRAAALGAVARIGTLTVDDVAVALEDPSPAVRRRALETAPGLAGRGTRSRLPQLLLGALDDPDPLVADAACFALGERRVRPAVEALARLAAEHPDTRCRESAVAALGAIGDPAGRAAVLGALEDKPTVRRRAVAALAAFTGPDVDAALERARQDRDWQVRQATEALLRE